MAPALQRKRTSSGALMHQPVRQPALTLRIYRPLHCHKKHTGIRPCRQAQNNAVRHHHQ